MKKMILSLAFAILTVSAFSLEATVVSTTGKVEVKSGAQWIKLNNGDSLKTGAVIQTGFKSEAILKIKGTTVTVAPLSRITLEQLASTSTKDETKIFLDAGSLKSDVKKIDDKRPGFTVRSPVATASVRGTVLTVSNGFRSTKVQTHEGTVAVWKSKNNGPEIAEESDSVETVTEVAAVENPSSADSSENAAAPVESVAAEAAPAPVTEAPKKDNSAAAVSDGSAPAGAFTVTRGQTAGFASTGAATSAQSNAAKTAYALPASTQSAASAEAVTTATVAPSTAPSTVTDTVVKPSKGIFAVTVEWD